MFERFQTVVQKSDNSLWIFNPINSIDCCDAPPSCYTADNIIGDIYGVFKEAIPDELAPICDEFGQVHIGEPQFQQMHPIYQCPYVTPDVSLKKYVGLTEDEKAAMRKENIAEMMKEFEPKLADAIENRDTSKHHFYICNDEKEARYRIGYYKAHLAKRASRVFTIGCINSCETIQDIYIFDGIPFLLEKYRFSRLDNLNIKGLEGLVEYLKESGYKSYSSR